MKHVIYLDQLTLEFWKDKKLDPKRSDMKGALRQRYLNHTLDADDAILVSFIADLNPQDEAVRDLMWRGHFLIKLDWLAERVPVLNLTEQTLYRRLRWLKLIGILECINRTVDGNKTLAYYRCSSLYWKIRRRRHEKAAEAAKATSCAEDSPEKAIVPMDYGEPENGKKAIVPMDLSHSPNGLASLSKIGNDYLRVPPPEALRASAADSVAGPDPPQRKRATLKLPESPGDRRLRIETRRRALQEQARFLGVPTGGDRDAS